uniref:Uncharacterized protein n=1 Tax=viral metagenome TaxID=1070528 RepID=A0A6C0JVB4_9ZZZZ
MAFIEDLKRFDQKIKTQTLHQSAIRATIKRWNIDTIVADVTSKITKPATPITREKVLRVVCDLAMLQGCASSFCFLRWVYETTGILPTAKMTEAFKKGVGIWIFDSEDYVADNNFYKVLLQHDPIVSLQKNH